jgi:predicted small lipoprotein YifL
MRRPDASPLPHLFCYMFRLRSVPVSLTDSPVLRLVAVSALLLGLGLALSGCGRKGPLDAPPASLAGPQPSALGTDAQGRDIAPPGQKRRLPIDVLLD